VAVRLARRGRSVAVVESGRANFDAAIHELNAIDDSAGRYTRALTGRYRGLGGSSTRWGGRMIPMTPADAGPRPHVRLPGWPLPIGELDRYDDELETLFATGHDSYDAIDQRAFYAPAGFPNDPQTFGARWAKCPSFRNSHLGVLLRQELETNPGLTVLLGATVCDFELDRERGRLQAVEARDFAGNRATVRAPEFIIAAGTIETTRLLLLLDRLAEGRAFRRTTPLGCYFQDHLKAEIATIDRRDAAATNRLFGYRFVNSVRRDLHLELAPAAQREDRVSSAFAYLSMDLSGSPLAAVRQLAHGMQRRQLDLAELGRAGRDLGLVAQAAYWRVRHSQLFVPPGIAFRLMICVEQLPHRANRISLSDQLDRLGVPQVRLDWAPRATEERTFRSAIDRLGRYWRLAGLDRLCPLVWNAITDPAATVIAAAEACAHPSGTTRMGTDPRKSVVGPDLRCHDLPNVAVASASVFPAAGSANPTFTIMRLAMRLADSYPPRSIASAPRRTELVQLH
jgi:choline dehydrogenase-like flavoprotein